MALLRNARLRRDFPFPHWLQSTRTISAVPRAEKRFIRATRIWISAVCRSGSLALMRSPKALRQHGAVAVAAGGERHRPDVRRGRVHRRMHLAPLAASLNAVLADLPFPVAGELDPGAVDRQVERTIGTATGGLDGPCLLPAAQSGTVRHGPTPGSPFEAGRQPCRSFALERFGR